MKRASLCFTVIPWGRASTNKPMPALRAVHFSFYGFHSSKLGRACRRITVKRASLCFTVIPWGRASSLSKSGQRPFCFFVIPGSSKLGRPCRRKQNPASAGLLDRLGGERGIRTPGPVTVNGFQDRRNRPLCHLSGSEINAYLFASCIAFRVFM